MIIRSIFNTSLSVLISVALLFFGAYILNIKVPGEVAADMVVAGICLIPLLVVVNYLSIAQNRSTHILTETLKQSPPGAATVVADLNAVAEDKPSALKNGWRRSA